MTHYLAAKRDVKELLTGQGVGFGRGGYHIYIYIYICIYLHMLVCIIYPISFTICYIDYLLGTIDCVLYVVSVKQ